MYGCLLGTEMFVSTCKSQVWVQVWAYVWVDTRGQAWVLLGLCSPCHKVSEADLSLPPEYQELKHFSMGLDFYFLQGYWDLNSSSFLMEPPTFHRAICASKKRQVLWVKRAVGQSLPTTPAPQLLVRKQKTTDCADNQLQEIA